MLGHLARLGGTLIRPRATLLAILRGDVNGKAWEIFPWVAVVAAAAAPIESGRAFLMMRVDPLLGLWSFVAMIADRSSAGLVGAVVAAFLLQVLFKVSFDRAFDCTMYMLVPYLLLATIGALLSAIGVEVWFMPHRRMTGSPSVVALRATVAYGWSIVLFGVVFFSLFKERRDAATPATT